ncbi:LysR family transcriptional regulator [Vibrio viridaestus]|uniref:LysR family transcriptional regulator n=1 Tax=Vibrio viridaestus TaxID=2487322 RepID=A0A3N9TJZ8_9VIBR|nr:LysR family transcriptional regulator [Vibrio viridaestus]RQW64597.1 LysR family transcriptional regulator [Vibrio viridaestus]
MNNNRFASIPVFIAVVEHGNISTAASHLGITKSAVSKRISQLEHELGVRLFHRSTRQINLTEAGQRYFFHINKAYQFTLDGVDAVTELQAKPKGKLSITTPMSFGVRHISPFLTEFLTRNPEVELDIQYEDKMINLIESGYDLAIRIGELPSSNLIARKLTLCKSVLCASPQYLQEHNEPVVPSDLKEHNCLVYSYFQGGTEWKFNRQGQIYSVPPKGNLRLNNSEGIRQATIEGLGISQLPTFIVGPDIRSGKLIPLMNQYQLPEHAVYAVYPHRHYVPTHVRAFIEFVQQRFDPILPYWDRGEQHSD